MDHPRTVHPLLDHSSYRDLVHQQILKNPEQRSSSARERFWVPLRVGFTPAALRTLLRHLSGAVATWEPSAGPPPPSVLAVVNAVLHRRVRCTCRFEDGVSEVLSYNASTGVSSVVHPPTIRVVAGMPQLLPRAHWPKPDCEAGAGDEEGGAAMGGGSHNGDYLIVARLEVKAESLPITSEFQNRRFRLGVWVDNSVIPDEPAGQPIEVSTAAGGTSEKLFAFVGSPSGDVRVTAFPEVSEITWSGLIEVMGKQKAEAQRNVFSGIAIYTPPEVTQCVDEMDPFTTVALSALSETHTSAMMSVWPPPSDSGGGGGGGGVSIRKGAPSKGSGGPHSKVTLLQRMLALLHPQPPPTPITSSSALAPIPPPPLPPSHWIETARWSIEPLNTNHRATATQHSTATTSTTTMTLVSPSGSAPPPLMSDEMPPGVIHRQGRDASSDKYSSGDLPLRIILPRALRLKPFHHNTQQQHRTSHVPVGGSAAAAAAATKRSRADATAVADAAGMVRDDTDATAMFGQADYDALSSRLSLSLVSYDFTRLREWITAIERSSSHRSIPDEDLFKLHELSVLPFTIFDIAPDGRTVTLAIQVRGSILHACQRVRLFFLTSYPPIFSSTAQELACHITPHGPPLPCRLYHLHGRRDPRCAAPTAVALATTIKVWGWQ